MAENTLAEKSGDLSSQLLKPTDRRSTAPLWSQVKLSLTDMIVGQGMTEHSRLPSEAELCRLFGVSRTVIREALGQLVNEGLIYRLQGKGAFVRARREQQGFAGSVVGFSGELAEKRKQVTRRILRQEVCKPTPRMRRYLQIDADDEIVAIDRVLSVEDVPRIIVRWAMLRSEVPGLESMPLENRSLYDTIGRQFGVRFVRAERWIEALSLGAADAHLLDVTPGHAALRIESLASSQTRASVEYYTATYLTDLSRLHFTVTSPAS